MSEALPTPGHTAAELQHVQAVAAQAKEGQQAAALQAGEHSEPPDVATPDAVPTETGTTVPPGETSVEGPPAPDEATGETSLDETDIARRRDLGRVAAAAGLQSPFPPRNGENGKNGKNQNPRAREFMEKGQALVDMGIDRSTINALTGWNDRSREGLEEIITNLRQRKIDGTKIPAEVVRERGVIADRLESRADELLALAGDMHPDNDFSGVANLASQILQQEEAAARGDTDATRHLRRDRGVRGEAPPETQLNREKLADLNDPEFVAGLREGVREGVTQIMEGRVRVPRGMSEEVFRERLNVSIVRGALAAHLGLSRQALDRQIDRGFTVPGLEDVIKNFDEFYHAPEPAESSGRKAPTLDANQPQAQASESEESSVQQESEQAFTIGQIVKVPRNDGSISVGKINNIYYDQEGTLVADTSFAEGDELLHKTVVLEMKEGEHTFAVNQEVKVPRNGGSVSDGRIEFFRKSKSQNGWVARVTYEDGLYKDVLLSDLVETNKSVAEEPPTTPAPEEPHTVGMPRLEIGWLSGVDVEQAALTTADRKAPQPEPSVNDDEIVDAEGVGGGAGLQPAPTESGEDLGYYRTPEEKAADTVDAEIVEDDKTLAVGGQPGMELELHPSPDPNLPRGATRLATVDRELVAKRQELSETTIDDDKAGADRFTRLEDEINDLSTEQDQLRAQQEQPDTPEKE